MVQPLDPISMFNLILSVLLGLLSLVEAVRPIKPVSPLKPLYPRLLQPRDDLPVKNYTCRGVGFIPDKGCYPEIYRGNTTRMQAWGAYLDMGAPVSLPPPVLAGLPVTCATAANAVCAYVDKNIGNAGVRGQWILQVSQAPGCLVGAYLPDKNYVPEPTYDDCYLHITQPMRRVWPSGASSGMTRVSVNIKEFPLLPATSDLVKTSFQGTDKFYTSSPGSAVNASVSSWFMEAFTWGPKDGPIGYKMRKRSFWDALEAQHKAKYGDEPLKVKFL